MTLEQVLEQMYASELNAQISCFWDNGWTVRLGDPINGFTATACPDDVAGIAPALDRLLREHYPGEYLAPAGGLIELSEPTDWSGTNANHP